MIKLISRFYVDFCEIKWANFSNNISCFGVNVDSASPSLEHYLFIQAPSQQIFSARFAFYLISVEPKDVEIEATLSGSTEFKPRAQTINRK